MSYISEPVDLVVSGTFLKSFEAFLVFGFSSRNEFHIHDGGNFEPAFPVQTVDLFAVFLPILLAWYRFLCVFLDRLPLYDWCVTRVLRCFSDRHRFTFRVGLSDD